MDSLEVTLEFLSGGTPQTSSATPEDKNLTVRLYIPRTLAARAAAEGEKESFPFLWKAVAGAHDIFELEFYPPFYHEVSFKISADEDFFLSSPLISNTLQIKTPDYKVSYAIGKTARIFCLYSHKSFDIDKNLKKGAIYHIFCDRFSNAGKYLDKNTRYNRDPYDEPEFAERGQPFGNDTHFGGNFEGICEKLDYLKSLGIKALYLSPISKARSNHKYDTGDYMTPDPSFGNEKELKKLIGRAHDMDMEIILDMVFNHSGSDSLYFNKYGRYPSVGAYSGTHSPYYDWYTFERFPDKYNCWWGIDILPAFNKNNEDFINFICGDGGVIDYYLSLGITGARLDVADELTLPFLERIYKKIKSRGGTIFGEVWENAATKISYGEKRRYFTGGKLDGVTNYPLRNGILHYLMTADAEELAKLCLEIYTDYPKEVSLNLMNIIGTHDTPRALTLLSGASDSGMTMAQKSRDRLDGDARQKGEALLKLAFFLSATLPGIPTVYYGDEVGMEGWGDPFNRRFMRWDMCGNSVNVYYKNIMRLRNNNRPLYEGGLKINCAKDGLFVFTRFCEKENAVCVVNMSHKQASLCFDKEVKTVLPKEASVFFCKEL